MVLAVLKRSLPSYQDELIGMYQWKDMVDRQERKHKYPHTAPVKEEHWTIDRGDNGQDTINILWRDDDVGVIDQTTRELQQMPHLLQQLKSLVTQSLPVILSRILHATPPILHEISRGYFVPFHTVALACLARIHSLLMKLGREVVAALRETVPLLRDLFSKETDKRIKAGRKKLHDLIMSPFGIDTKYATTETNASVPSATSVSPPSNEWNTLMGYFIDANHDEITKQMNEYVKEKQWESAMRKLGLGSSESATPSRETELQSDNYGENNSGEFDNVSCYTNNIQHQEVSEVEEIPELSCSDTGELVAMHLENDAKTTQNTSPAEDAIDENMARIIKEKAKRASKSMSGSTEMSESKKKRRKKKKKKREQKCFADNDISTDVADRLIPEQHDNPAGTTKSAHVTMIPMGATDVDRLDPPEEVGVKSSNELANVDKSTNEGVSSKDVASKAKKDRKKKKRKSTSVIDDIFGF
jgi:hypothetical protein